MTKKTSSEIFENRRGFFQNFFRMLSENIFSVKFCHPIFVTQIFAPPNIYDKSTPVVCRTVSLIFNQNDCTQTGCLLGTACCAE